ncbi:TPM domain-containing protein [Nocardioides albidus]|uniref:TPM domain-containing protein n=1 Tax=Nocardioides albidus TaxID=1517589 RepID=A0A5C4VQJ8_9ACTN|nr:TPM domain-containing protein [Nocardioides albidus]TNM37529.1 TPM domain-containing protein [Nocardioides albidus]
MSTTALSATQRATLDVTMRNAEQLCRAEISVFVGAATGAPRDFATSLHNTLVLPSRSILIMVDPDRRVVEIVTGGHARERFTDEEAQQVVAAMTVRFAAGDLAGGLTEGIELLGQLAKD